MSHGLVCNLSCVPFTDVTIQCVYRIFGYPHGCQFHSDPVFHISPEPKVKHWAPIHRLSLSNRSVFSGVNALAGLC